MPTILLISIQKTRRLIPLQVTGVNRHPVGYFKSQAN